MTTDPKGTAELLVAKARENPGVEHGAKGSFVEAEAVAGHIHALMAHDAPPYTVETGKSEDGQPFVNLIVTQRTSDDT